jgi:predicted GIY-YIG superfamily endonuclease
MSAAIRINFWSKTSSNLTDAWQICGNFSANPWRPQHPSPSRIRREKAGSCRMKKTRRSFAFGSSQRNRMTLMFGAAPPLRAGFKRLVQLRISHHTAQHARRASSHHAPQVLQATMNFRRGEAAQLAMRIKRLKRRTFSLSLARPRPRTAFSLPQRA